MSTKLIDLYNIYIYERYKDLKKTQKLDYDNNDLSKIFEWFSCIFLSNLHKTQFYHYDDINPEFKEQHQLSRNDTGIDASDLKDSIVQCKLRKNSLSWKECSTFFASQNIFDESLNTTIVKWKNLIITRNSDSTLSDNLKFHSRKFIDTIISKKEILDYCENIILNPPTYPKSKDTFITHRPYQLEAIDLINSSSNLVICIPTGGGKNIIITYSFQKDKHYLILVPRIILTEQLKDEIIKHKPELKHSIQIIGDGNTIFNKKHTITICVYNSIEHVLPHIDSFHKIFIDEAHHIKTPSIYEDVDYNDDEDDEDDKESDIDENDDMDEDEDKKYLNIISDLSKYNNNVYLSATIDEQKGFDFYKKDIREMINEGYLCDYTINIPIFENDPTNKNICDYLVKNYKNIIIYCNSQKEGKKINKLLNSIQKDCCEYIDCKTSRKKRNDIIKSYKNGDIPFLVNVRILVEGFDAPITKGVCFFHLPSNKTTIIQIIGRALRLHPLKTLASIILPFSNKEDEDSIVNFIRELSQNDSRIRHAYIDKKTSGYINITKVEKETEDDKDDDDNDDDDDEKEQKEDSIEFRYELIYNSLGVLVNRQELWEENLKRVKEYIDKYNKRPSSDSKNKNVKKIGRWTNIQSQNFKKNRSSMKNELIKKLWEEFINDQKYKEYFLSNEDKWMRNLNKVKEYIDINNKRPSSESLDKNIKSMGYWLLDCTDNFKNNRNIMKEKNIRKIWEEFINQEKYQLYFLTGEELWKNKLKNLKIYIDINNQKPSINHKDKNINIIGKWTYRQIENYKNYKENMKEENIRKLWEDFIMDDKYKEYFLTNEEVWMKNLEKTKQYIDNHKNKPSVYNKEKIIKSLGGWLSNQLRNYKNNKEIMKKEDIRKIWEEFINDNKYEKYFK